MSQEIERKFLVQGDFKPHACRHLRITQGYLSSVPERTVRIRLVGEQGFLTIKGKTNATGVSRFEWEKAISAEEARTLLTLCEPGIIDKTRYWVEVGKHCYEVDEFHGENQGLRVAELELEREDEPFCRPDWLGAEVTGDARYYNAMLSRKPYTKWRHDQ